MALSLRGVLQTDIDKAAKKKEEGIFVLDFQVPHDAERLRSSVHSFGYPKHCYTATDTMLGSQVTKREKQSGRGQGSS